MHPINFIFKNLGEYCYEKVESIDVSLSVKNEFEQREKLILIDAHVGTKTLGVSIAPNGDVKDEFNALSKKVAKWFNVMKIRRLPGFETLLCMNTTIIKT